MKKKLKERKKKDESKKRFIQLHNLSGHWVRNKKKK